MLSFALSTGTHLATSYFHLPFDEDEDQDIQNYERKNIAWAADPPAGSVVDLSGHPQSSLTSSQRHKPDEMANSRKRTCTQAGICTDTSPISSGPSSPSSSSFSLLSACSSSASLSSMSCAATSGSSDPAVMSGIHHGRSASEPLSSMTPSTTPTSSKVKGSSYHHPRGSSSPSSRPPSPNRTAPSSHQPQRVFNPNPPLSSPALFSSPTGSVPPPTNDDSLIRDVIRDNNLYSILGLTSNASPDKMTLRRAYLARSRLCHPECVKFAPLSNDPLTLK